MNYEYIKKQDKKVNHKHWIKHRLLEKKKKKRKAVNNLSVVMET